MDKRNAGTIALAACISLGLIAMPIAGAIKSDRINKDAVNALQREVQTLQTEVQSRQNDVQALEQKHSADTDTINQLQAQVTDLQKQLEEAKNKTNF